MFSSAYGDLKLAATAVSYSTCVAMCLQRLPRDELRNGLLDSGLAGDVFFFFFLNQWIWNSSAYPKTSSAEHQDILHVSAPSLGRLSELLFEQARACLLENDTTGSRSKSPTSGHRRPMSPEVLS